MSSSKKNDTSPLAALAPLHALVQLVPVASAGTSTGTGDERKEAYILLTSLEPDAWLVHVGHPNGHWWNGSWRAPDVERLATGNMSPARLGAFAQRVASTIVKREVAVAHDDNFRNMKLVLGTQAKKPLRVALSELDAEDTARFTFEYFARVAEDAQAHGCRMFHAHGGHTDTETDPQVQPRSHSSLKRRRTQSYDDPSPASSRAPSPIPPSSRKIRDAGRRRPDDDDDDTPLPATSRGGTQRPHDRSAGKHKAPQTRTQTQTPAERAALAELQELKAELVKARADAAAAVALAAEREPPGLGGSVDRLRSRTGVPAVPRRPGASLANPNKAARRVTAVEFASDSDDA